MKQKKKVRNKENSVKRKSVPETKASAERQSYLQFSWPFMALIFVFGVAMMATLEFGFTTRTSFHPLAILAAIATLVAGASAVKNGFKLRQVGIIGALCFLGIFWITPLNMYYYFSSLPITANYFAINFIASTIVDLVINFAIFIFVALVGGFVSSRVN